MKVITIANQKGGISKTTTALCIGAELEEKGYKVLYIDLDKQNDTSRALRADREQKGVYEMLVDKTPARDLVQVTENGHHVISGNDKIAVIDIELNAPKNQVGKEYRMKESLESVQDSYDYALIDTATDLNPATINALTCSDYLIIPTTADAFSTDGLITLLNIADVIKQYTNKDLKIAGVLLARYSDRSNINRAYKEEIKTIAERYNTRLFNAYVRENISIRESQALKRPITEYAPKSNGNLDYLAVTDELLKEIEG